MTGLMERLDAATLSGMGLSVWAEVQPDKPCVIDPDGRVRSFAEVNANANRLVRLLRQAGLSAGDSVAVLASNRAEFVEVLPRIDIRVGKIPWSRGRASGRRVEECQVVRMHGQRLGR